VPAHNDPSDRSQQERHNNRPQNNANSEALALQESFPRSNRFCARVSHGSIASAVDKQSFVSFFAANGLIDETPGNQRIREGISIVRGNGALEKRCRTHDSHTTDRIRGTLHDVTVNFARCFIRMRGLTLRICRLWISDRRQK
jgi:hypothetical protein